MIKPTYCDHLSHFKLIDAAKSNDNTKFMGLIS
jgi:hypothetical protein